MTTLTSRVNVLVVEDEESLLRGIVRGLEKDPSLHLTGCPSAEDAMSMIGAHPPDLLITDINLPGISGLELVTRIRKVASATPVIAMTAHKSAYRNDLAGFQSLFLLEKPISIVNLRKVLDELLERPRHDHRASPFQLIEYLQLAGMGRHSLTIHVQLDDGRKGALEIVHGDIWNASVGDVNGEDALVILLRETVEDLSCIGELHEPAVRQIQRGWQALLFDLARIDDEQKRQSASTDASADQLSSNAREACRQLVEAVPGCLAACIVNSDSATPSGSWQTKDAYSDYLRAVGVLAVHVFGGSHLLAIEEHFARGQMREVHGGYGKAYIASTNDLYFMVHSRTLRTIAVMIAELGTNQALCWAMLKDMIENMKNDCFAEPALNEDFL